jgi:hypothetical protein
MLAALVPVAPPPLRANSLLLDATTKSLEVQTSAAVSTDYVVSYADHTSSAFTPGLSQGNISTATTTTILAAPGASTQRQVKWVSVTNRSATTAQTVTLKLDVSATEYALGPAVTLAAGESLRVDATGGFTVLSATGRAREYATEPTGIGGFTLPVYKTTSAGADATAYWYAWAKDAGSPGAYSLGSPGLNGYNTDCGTLSNATNPVGATQAGAHYLPDPSTGAYYLTGAVTVVSVAQAVWVVDVLWYNTGIAVTTTTAQTITMPGALPARDARGLTDGYGVMAALLTTTANTNASAISNTTISYTNEAGTASRTGTFVAVAGSQAPATPVIGTWMPFALAAGDRGIRSVQSITLGTSYGGGALSLVLFRPIVMIPNPSVNVGWPGLLAAPTASKVPPGVRIYNDTCFWFLYGPASATTATVMAGALTIVER